jgi:hypothetical protein
MASMVFSVSSGKDALKAQENVKLAELGLTEPTHLETWLASTGKSVFNRDILWVARQDHPSDGQRSDLVGVAREGDLLIVELKRGSLGSDAITQALSYAAEYASLDADGIADMYQAHSSKDGFSKLAKKASDFDEAHNKLAQHVGENELNETQILILVAEDFYPNALAICDYLNNSLGEATRFSLECWQYSIWRNESRELAFVLEQVLPAQEIRDTIEEKREEFKQRRHSRSFNMQCLGITRAVRQVLIESHFSTSGRRGAKYFFAIELMIAEKPEKLLFTAYPGGVPSIILPAGVVCTRPIPNIKTWSDGQTCIELLDLKMGEGTLSNEIRDELVSILNSLRTADSAAPQST